MEIPNVMLNTQGKSDDRRLRKKNSVSRATMEQYLQFTGSTPASLQEQMKPQAMQRIQTDWFWRRSQKLKNIQIADEK